MAEGREVWVVVLEEDDLVFSKLRAKECMVAGQRSMQSKHHQD